MEDEALWSAAAKSLQLCPTLCDSLDGSPPGSSVPGILQVRIHSNLAQHSTAQFVGGDEDLSDIPSRRLTN